MQRILLVLLAVVASGFVFGQGLKTQATNYGTLEWDVLRLSAATALDNQSGGGLSFGSELRFNATNLFSGGIRFEAAGLVKEQREGLTDVRGVGSWVLIGDKYFQGDSPNRGFFGFGIGFFGGYQGQLIGDNDDIINESRVSSVFGFVPRVGMEIGHLRASLEYNATPNEAVANYLALQIAGTLGGGYRPRAVMPAGK